MKRERPTGAQVRDYRDLHECGVQEAKGALMDEWRKNCLYDIRLNASELYTVEQCRDVIVDLLDLLMDSSS